MMGKKRIYVLDTEKKVVGTLRNGLMREGFAVTVAADGASALEQMQTTPPDLVILELDLPGLGGWEVCRRLRSTGNVPIIILSRRLGEMDRVLSLEIGADDYLTKPFSFRELLARARALFRRVGYHQGLVTGAVQVGDIAIDPSTRQAICRGQSVPLSRREYALLKVLMRQAGRVVPRDDLLAAAWEEGWIGNTRTVDVHIHWLREKIEENPKRPKYIQTVRGVGYRFATGRELERPRNGPGRSGRTGALPPRNGRRSIVGSAGVRTEDRGVPIC